MKAPLLLAGLLAIAPGVAAQSTPVCRNRPTFTCNKWPGPEDCWCGEWTDAIWAQRHYANATRCSPGFTLQGYSQDRWGYWAREEVGTFLRYMESVFGDDNRDCKNPRRPVDWREVEAVYWQSQCFSGYSGTGLADLGKCARRSQGAGADAPAKAAKSQGMVPAGSLSSGGEPAPRAGR